MGASQANQLTLYSNVHKIKLNFCDAYHSGPKNFSKVGASPYTQIVIFTREEPKERTSNIERSTSNFKWQKMKKPTYGPKIRLLEYSVRIAKIVELLPKNRKQPLNIRH